MSATSPARSCGSTSPPARTRAPHIPAGCYWVDTTTSGTSSESMLVIGGSGRRAAVLRWADCSLAASEDKGAAYTCGVLLGRHYYVGNVVREHVGNWRFRKARGRTSVGRLQSRRQRGQGRRIYLRGAIGSTLLRRERRPRACW